MNGTSNSPFGRIGNAPLPGGGGNYLTFGEDKQPARHVVMIEGIRYKAPGFKSPAGTVIFEYQMLKTDTTNHKVGATYTRTYNLQGQLALGNVATDLAQIRSAILGRAVQPAEVTPEITEAATGLRALDASSDPDFAALGLATYRGQVLTAVCWNKPTQKGAEFTACAFSAPTPQDLQGLEHLFQQ